MHTSCCCKGADISSLVGILEQEIAITVRWGQVFQAGGIPVPSYTGLSDSDVSCNDTRLQLLSKILTQKNATFNAMFFG